jgi:hypothetical protein
MSAAPNYTPKECESCYSCFHGISADNVVNVRFSSCYDIRKKGVSVHLSVCGGRKEGAKNNVRCALVKYIQSEFSLRMPYAICCFILALRCA